MGFTLDTNVIIYYLKGDPITASTLKDIFSEDVPLYVSTITEAELFGFSGLTKKESEEIDKLLGTLAIISLDSRIARIAGLLRRFYNLKTADSVIAATALFTGSTLVTRNAKDFRKIPKLPLLSI